MTSSASLDQITDFHGLIHYLRDALEWEIPEEVDFDDLTFHWSPSEIGLELEEPIAITQLRPLTTDQRWGVFFLNFPQRQLPVTVMRRILRGLSKRKRASANAADRAAWEKEDLLFISAVGGAQDRRLSFAHFQDRGSDLPTLRVIGWDKDDTVRRLSHTDQLLRSRLGWRHGQGLPLDWRNAFSERPRESIRTAKAMAEALAVLAQDIRDRIKLILPRENADGDLRKLYDAVQQTLSRDLDVPQFADTYAQTIAYGLLSARINQVRERDERHEGSQQSSLAPKPPLPRITADAAGQAMPTTNPFLRELFGSFLSAGGRDAVGSGLDFDELGVGEVVDLLNAADIEAVLLDFDKEKAGDDPVIHFYEGFLNAYDKELKVQRGVFYTPRPVVSFIVRSVHQALMNDFGLPDGLADTTTWSQFVAANPNANIPDGIGGSEPFVKVLDPAVGTGTFLVEAIDLIHATMSAKWKGQGLSGTARLEAWNDYVPSHLLPRLVGFELMMAAYAVAHMKIGLKLADTGYNFDGHDENGSPARARVFLTNALDAPHDLSSELEFMSAALAHESRATNSVKEHGGFTVIFGNPPYANYSSNLTIHARSLVDKYRSFNGSPIRERNQLQFERNLQDDYVKFVSVAEAFISSSGYGILGYITNATSLSSTSLRGMREHLINQFSNLSVVHLHGGANEISDDAAGDQNVFDIAQAVAIHLYVRNQNPPNKTVSYTDIWGSREAKYALLESSSVGILPLETVCPDKDNSTFSRQAAATSIDTIRITDVFSKFGGGIKTNRDDIAIGLTREECLSSARIFLAASHHKANESQIEAVTYRPLDFRFVYYDDKVVKSRSFPTMQNFIKRDNVGILASSSWTSPERFSVSVSDKIAEMKSGTHDRGTTLFPLFRYESILDGPVEKVSNFTSQFLDRWHTSTGTRIVDRDPIHDGDVSSVEVFQWMYALCNATAYRDEFRSSVAQGFPVACFPRDRAIFKAVSDIGAELVALHLLDPVGAPILANPKVHFVAGSEPRLGTMNADVRRTSAGRVHINDLCWFETVPERVWNYWLSGYQPAQKWLKDRAAKGGAKAGPGRVLTETDLLGYRRIIAALGRSIELVSELDHVIASKGGWPTILKGLG